VGPRAGLDVCEKSRPPPGFDHRTVQPVASRYTDSSPGPVVGLKQLIIGSELRRAVIHYTDG
jgi:hypothetical protein